MYNKVNQLHVYIYPHIRSLLCLPPTLPIPPLYVVTKHRTNFPVLCDCFPLVIYFTFGSVYMSMPLSHFVPAYPSPSPCPQVHSVLSCMNCLYILEINHLSIASFANILSHSVCCLFVLFMVSFAAQKLLSFIISHLFIFVFIFTTL